MGRGGDPPNVFPMPPLPHGPNPSRGKPWSLFQVYPRNDVSSTLAIASFLLVHRHLLFSPPAQEGARKEGGQMEAKLQT